MTNNEQAIWNAAFGAAYVHAHVSWRDEFATMKGCQDYARLVANDAVVAYREVAKTSNQ
jgi:hypothetical protein